MAWASNKLFKMDKSKTIIGSYYAIINLSNVALKMYLYLLNTNEKFRPTIQGMATICHVSKMTAQKALEELKEQGYLRVEEISKKEYEWFIYSGNQESNSIDMLTKPSKRKAKEDKEKQKKIKDLQDIVDSGELYGETLELILKELEDLMADE